MSHLSIAVKALSLFALLSTVTTVSAQQQATERSPRPGDGSSVLVSRLEPAPQSGSDSEANATIRYAKSRSDAPPSIGMTQRSPLGIYFGN